MVLASTHVPRPVRFLRVSTFDEWHVKVYGIAATTDRPRLELVDAGLDVATSVLRTDAVDHHGHAFVIAHDAADYCFVLVDWFARENEIHQRMYSAALSRPTELRPHPTGAIGCVWELAVVDFERRAWLTHILANLGGADFVRYRAAHLDTSI